MSILLEMLEEMGLKESRVRAVLKRSLAFNPGIYPPAFAYVEPYLKDDDGSWKRKMYYLVGGLWAQHWRAEHIEGHSLPSACAALYAAKEKSPSIEKRFIALLDADEDQLPYRLRQMTALLKEYPIDFDALLHDLIYWNNHERFVQIRWGKTFYHTQSIPETENETTDTKEK